MLPEPVELKRWKERNTNWQDILQKRAFSGTVIHHRILNKIAARSLELPEVPPEGIPDDLFGEVERAESMWESIGFDIGHPRRIENTVYHHEYPEYAGKFDMMAPIDGVLTLVDLKTSRSAQYGSYGYQLGGYYAAVDEKPERGMVVAIHVNEKNNPTLSPHIAEFSRAQLEKLGDMFLELADGYHKKRA